jgi:hypothetical protein
MPVVALCLHRGGTAGARRELARPDAGSQGKDHGTGADFLKFGERIARAPTSRLILCQYAAFDQIENVSVCRVLRALGQFRPFRRGQLTLEPVQQPIDDLPLSVVERLPSVNFPESSFPEHARQSELRAVKGAVQAAKEPPHPRRDIQRVLLDLFQNPVVVVPF